VILKNPYGHFDVLQPYGGCKAGHLELPSTSGRNFSSSNSRWDLRSSAADSLSINRKKLFSSYYENVSSLNTKLLASAFEKVSGLGCQVVTNAGFFNVTSGVCFGDVISNGNIC
jgi:hypothetical protein